MEDVKGSFEHISEWWDEKAGDSGDPYNRFLILPALLETLGDPSGARILDVGAGNGMSSRALARLGARVTGVEISPSLVNLARLRERAEPFGVEYVISDAAHMPMFAAETFDSVVMNMVLMDAENAEGILQEAARVLVPGGRFVASLLHPCFEVPTASDWAVENTVSGQRLVRRVWRYREPLTCNDRISKDQPDEITRFHRPLSWYAARLREAGLLIYALNEPTGDEQFAQLKPHGYSKQKLAPTFLVIGAMKLGDVAGR